jgi:hypothetical protein
LPCPDNGLFGAIAGKNPTIEVAPARAANDRLRPNRARLPMRVPEEIST